MVSSDNETDDETTQTVERAVKRNRGKRKKQKRRDNDSDDEELEKRRERKKRAKKVRSARPRARHFLSPLLLPSKPQTSLCLTPFTPTTGAKAQEESKRSRGREYAVFICRDCERDPATRGTL